MPVFFSKNIIFQQLFEASTHSYTYILADADTLEGIIIDPVLEMVERDYRLIQELSIKLRYILETHVHADHITGGGKLSQYTHAPIAMSENSGAKASLFLKDGQVLYCGKLKIKVIATPGHTKACLSYHIGNAVFTGDALLIRANGRSDFQDGDAATLYDSIMHKLYTLSDDTLVFSAHDYAGFTSSSIGMEKQFNRRITANTTKEYFLSEMHSLNLPLPEKIALAVPANLNCGLTNHSTELPHPI